MGMGEIWIYILLCSDNSYYTGITHDLETRVFQHNMGYYKGYTFSIFFLKLVYYQKFSKIIDAIVAERQIKKWSRAKKEALIKNDFNLLHELAQCRNKTHYRTRDKK